MLPIIGIKSGGNDPGYMVTTDDHRAMRIIIAPPDPPEPSAATSSVTPQSKMVSYSAR